MAKDYQYYFSQLRRIEDHREQQAEKEIRKLYRKILKETRQFIAEEYYQLAEDGKLTFEILRSKSMDARFLQEVEERLGDLSIDVSREIKRTVEEMYQLSYDGLRNAVEKGKDSKELQDFFQGVDTATAQTAWASVDNTIMDVALEKNHKNIIWDIKREVATALTVGDRFDTMADRIAGKLNGNYKKAILIARTEVGRVREAGHLASAKNLNDALQEGSSGMRMVKKWMTMRDGGVRDTHSRMNGVIVEMDGPFILPSGVKTMAPKQSGVAAEDCNCRCYVSYQLMDDEEFFKATGRHFDKWNKENATTDEEESLVVIGGVDCAVSEGKYGFGDGTATGVKKTIDAVTYTTPDGTNFVFPKKYNKKQLTMTPEQAISCWQRVPQNIRAQAQKTIEFVDYYNPQDTKWRKLYKNFRHSYATGGAKITFYRYDYPHNDDYVVRTFCHEAGHLIDTTKATNSSRFSAESLWTKAMADDKLLNGKKSCTKYGENANTEDFAESIAEYVKDKVAFTKDFPNRAAILATII